MIKRSSPTKYRISISQTTARSKHKHSINTQTQSQGGTIPKGKRREESIELTAWPALQVYADSIATKPSKKKTTT